MKKSTKNCSKA